MHRNAVGPEFAESGQQWLNVGADNQIAPSPSLMNREEKRMESRTFIPATTQDPTQP